MAYTANGYSNTVYTHEVRTQGERKGTPMAMNSGMREALRLLYAGADYLRSGGHSQLRDTALKCVRCMFS